MSVLIFAMLLSSKDFLVYKNTEIFKQLLPARVAVTEDQHIFFLDIKEKIVLHYQPDGKRLANIGGAGQGPGEFVKPIRLRWFHGVLYVFDRKKVSSFSKDGHFIREFKKPSDILSFSKVEGGWLGLSGLLYGQCSTPMKLIFFDTSLTRRATLFSWQKEEDRGGKGLHFRTIFINPAPPYSALLVSRSGRIACVIMEGLEEVFIFDVERKALVRKIKIEGPPIPFNVEWGKRYFEKGKSLMPPKTADKLKPEFPEYFPIIRGMWLSLEEHILVKKWISPSMEGDPFNNYLGPTLCFSFGGDPVAITPLDLLAQRLAALEADWGYIITITPDEEYTLTRVPKALVAKFINDNPLPDATMDDF